MEETGDRPKWLLELENRKQKPRLAHEAGAGAPCTVCNSACPGLDLHFWRKICKNCKCSRDDHDVDDDEFPQFDLLFGPSAKFKKKPILLRVNKKQHEAETAFEWVPPDTTTELATDYMKALPIEKLPIKGSAGAVLRRQLLQKQLPLHDIDHKACDELTDQEKKQFDEYLENLKKFVGQGKVIKMLAARPFDRSLMTPINATDMQRFSPQHKPNIPPGTQLRTPSSFAKQFQYSKNPFDKYNKQDLVANTSLMHDQENTNIPARYDDTLSTVPTTSEIASSKPIESSIHGVASHSNDLAPSTKLKPCPSTAPYNLLKSSTPIHTAEQGITPSLGLNYSKNLSSHPRHVQDTQHSGATTSEDSRTAHLHKETLKNPASCLTQSEKINSASAQFAESVLADALLPPSAVHANDIIGSTLDEKRLMFIREKLTDKYSNTQENPMRSFPKLAQELSDPLQKKNNSKESFASGDKIKDATEKQTILPVGVQAEKNVYKPSSQIVQSSPLDLPAAGSNNETQNLANDITSDKLLPVSRNEVPINTNQIRAEISNSVPVQSNVIHSENLRHQIFPHEAVDVRNQTNTECLQNAMEGLTVDTVKSQKCHKCQEEIRVGDVAVIAEKAKNASWHPGCFVCSVCNELLVDLVYFYYKNKLYCGRDLATLLGIPRCYACDELIFVREYTVAEGHNYHVKHFCCWDCDMPLAGQQYITENDRPLCLPCYQRSYAKTCNACNVVIAADQQGVAVKDLNFHATEMCFCCHSCKKNLLNSKMAVKENKLFCSKECISKFLNR